MAHALLLISLSRSQGTPQRGAGGSGAPIHSFVLLLFRMIVTFFHSPATAALWPVTIVHKWLNKQQTGPIHLDTMERVQACADRDREGVRLY